MRDHFLPYRNPLGAANRTTWTLVDSGWRYNHRSGINHHEKCCCILNWMDIYTIHILEIACEAENMRIGKNCEFRVTSILLVPLCLGRFHHTSPSHLKVALNSTQLLTTTLQYSDMTRSLPPSSVWKYIYFRRFFNQDWLKSRGVGLFFVCLQMRHPTSGCAFLKLLPS